MPSRLHRHKNYNLVDESKDTRIPPHNEDAFQHGIFFKAKYIGSLDVPRPTGRMEIVVAMRKIRYEFKVKQIKKRKVNVTISVDGVKIALRKKKKKKDWNWGEDHNVVMNDPVYRIFYVSHDSHDLKIWSYIARDGQSNKFHCNVFKSNKQSHAMRIVRTIGQAFEVCHKFNNPQLSPHIEHTSVNKKENTPKKEIVKGGKDDKTGDEQVEETDIDATDDTSPVVSPRGGRKGVTDLDALQEEKSKTPSDCKSSKTSTARRHPSSEVFNATDKPTITQHRKNLLQLELNQAQQHVQVALAQVHLLKSQLAAEVTARTSAQAMNHQLLQQNQDLMKQVKKLLKQLIDAGEKPNDSTVIGNIDETNSETKISNSLLASPYMGLTQQNQMIPTDLFENTNVSAPPGDFPDLKNSATDIHQASYSGLSIVANDHVKKDRKHSRVNGHVDSSFTVSSSSSSESSSSSSDDEVGSPGATYSHKPFTEEDGRKSNLWPASNFNNTHDTSVWTSGIQTPMQQQHTSAESSMSDSLLTNSSQKISQAGSNSYTLSPIYSTNQTNASFTPTSPRGDKSNNNPIKWRQLSPPPPVTSVRSNNALPHIDPPPKSTRAHHLSASLNSSRPTESSSLNDSLFVVTDSSRFLGDQEWPSARKDSMTLFDPMKFSLSDRTVDASVTSASVTLSETKSITGSTNTSLTSNKLFDFQPEAYERQLRYEPLRKVQAGAWRVPSSAEQSAKSTPMLNSYQIPSMMKLTLPAASETEADITVGSILDEIEIPPERFMEEFWEGDTAETMKTQRLPEVASDKETSSSDVEDPLAVLDSLSGSLVPDPSYSKQDWTSLPQSSSSDQNKEVSEKNNNDNSSQLLFNSASGDSPANQHSTSLNNNSSESPLINSYNPLTNTMPPSSKSLYPNQAVGSGKPLTSSFPHEFTPRSTES